MAGELWLLLIELAGKVKWAEEMLPRVRKEENREMVDDFIESGERLTDKFKKLLKTCETPMLKAGKKGSTSQLGKNAGIEFVDVIFGRDRQLENTEKFMSSIRLWNLRFDANCEDILRHPGCDAGGWLESGRHDTRERPIIMTPVSIRTAFGLEDIAEEWAKEVEAENLANQRKMVESERSRINPDLERDKSNDSHQKGIEASEAMPLNNDCKATPSIPRQFLDDEWGSFSASKKDKKKKEQGSCGGIAYG
jgi:hypothetical protein